MSLLHAAQWVCEAASHLHTGSISGWRCALYACYGALLSAGVPGDVPHHPVGQPENLKGVPAHPHSGERETNATHQVSLVLGGSLSSWRDVMVPQSSLCSLFLLLVVQKLFNWLTVASHCQCTFNGFLGGGELSTHLCRHLGPAPHSYVLNQYLLNGCVNE